MKEREDCKRGRVCKTGWEVEGEVECFTGGWSGGAGFERNHPLRRLNRDLSTRDYGGVGLGPVEMFHGVKT